MSARFDKILSSGDLRSIGSSQAAVLNLHSQKAFDELFRCLFHADRLVVMRAADSIEKITIQHPHYLVNHEKEIFQLCQQVKHKELQWHLALLLPRLRLSKTDFKKSGQLLATWAADKNASRIVRVNALQGLAELTQRDKSMLPELQRLMSSLAAENIPSLTARIKRIKKIYTC
jgi:hypothetical protein